MDASLLQNAQLESQYNSLLREYESIQSEHTLETVKLKEEITNLRAEMEAILVELQTLMDAKLSLELEIAAYRKLLESEESRCVIYFLMLYYQNCKTETFKKCFFAK